MLEKEGLEEGLMANLFPGSMPTHPTGPPTTFNVNVEMKNRRDRKMWNCVEYLVLIRVFRPYLTTLLFLSLSLNSGWGGEIVVATSANVSYAIDALIERFNRVHPEIKVKKVVSSSGKLTSQILHKAPYDIFLSADTIYPKRLYSEGVCFKPKIYAKGCLAIFSKKERDFHRGLNILPAPIYKKSCHRQSEVLPYGRAT